MSVTLKTTKFFILIICLLGFVPAAFGMNTAQQNQEDQLSKKADRGDANSQLQLAILKERINSDKSKLGIKELLKAQAYYKAACENKLQKGCDGYNRLKKRLVKYDLFSEYSVRHIYAGPFKKPDFKGRDQAYRKYRTYITTAAEEGPNFAGKYAITSIGCGTGCSLSYVVNTQTGQVLGRLPIDGETNDSADLEYHLNSNIVLVRYPIVTSYGEDAPIVQIYNKLLFNGKKFELLRSSYSIDGYCSFDDLETAWYICADHS